MAKVHFSPADKVIEVQEGITILQAARQAGLAIEAPCNGVGTCGKCKVKLDQESINNVISKGVHHLTLEEEAEGWVLSCETEIRGDISVQIVSKQKQNKSLKILSYGKSFDVELNSYIIKQFNSTKNITEVYGGPELLGAEEGDTRDKNYGVVVDIGTTTIVTSLVDINTGEELESASGLNPQSIHGQDVLSRINFASDENGLEIMYSDLISLLNQMITDIAQRTEINTKNIYEVIFSGNTCMLHLATRVNPYSLGKYPYTPLVTGGNYLSAQEHRIKIAEFGLIYLPPIISAYVGPDITSGILASELRNREGVTLLVDIGTNGEMVIGVNGELSATSTAAGPAFEGMNITHGMRAGLGAIEFFEIHDLGEVEIKTIGDAEAVGICGSGLLDIVGELVDHGIINKSGRLVKPGDTSIPEVLRNRLVKQDGKTVFQITEKVYLTQKDIRQVQLAKGAIRVGIEFLLKDKEIDAADVDKVLIAGSFGFHLREKSLINLGLLPEEFAGKIEFIGNTSKSGGQAFLLNKGYKDKMYTLVKEIEVLELANFEDFDKAFVNCLNF